MEEQIAELKSEVRRLTKIIKYSNVTYHECEHCTRILNPKYRCKGCNKIVCRKCDKDFCSYDGKFRSCSGCSREI